MAASAVEGDAETSRTEGAIDDSIVAGAVERDARVRAFAEVAEQMLDAAEIARAFLAHRCREHDGAPRAQPLAIHRLGEREHGGESPRIIDDAGSGELASLAGHTNVCALGKDGVQVRAEQYRCETGGSAARSDDVAYSVRVDVAQSDRLEAIRDRCCALALGTRGRRDLREVDLCLQQPLVGRREQRAGWCQSGEELGQRVSGRLVVGAHWLSMVRGCSSAQDPRCQAQ